MTRFFWLREDKAVTASYDAAHRWGLPGVMCPTCGATWASAGHQYPAVDLSQLPERREFERARPEPFSEFARLRELVRPLAPPNAALPPGTTFGPLVGRASGRFGAFTSQGSIRWLVRRDALERLQAEGVRGLLGCRTELRFRQKDPPELLELQLEPHGRLHPDCIPPNVPPPCVTCGWVYFRLPDEPILDAASLPPGLDLFRVGDYSTVIVGTERFMEAVRRLELDGITFHELPTR
ncbi:SitI6 family double-CXXCG motif immunity protein [Pyxidicoccus xibeiensis]|uniref:SitI6 family double-CXXCG motif immunity protein n=1 Tax=Pyxidicoccus xibeiensis TaxID=2906759 RepID=UPI0020A71886|nr:double-CXXCG motif protein [Pyxidicoccus xibeiensis]MCP3139906.1 double-CXXCG motif protein [Pyxidicoccus xibeiensis]